MLGATQRIAPQRRARQPTARTTPALPHPRLPSVSALIGPPLQALVRRPHLVAVDRSVTGDSVYEFGPGRERGKPKLRGDRFLAPSGGLQNEVHLPVPVDIAHPAKGRRPEDRRRAEYHLRGISRSTPHGKDIVSNSGTINHVQTRWQERSRPVCEDLPNLPWGAERSEVLARVEPDLSRHVCGYGSRQQARRSAYHQNRAVRAGNPDARIRSRLPLTWSAGRVGRIHGHTHSI